MGRTERFGIFGIGVSSDGAGNQIVVGGDAGAEIVPSAKVYYPEEAPLYLGEGIPLYLTWIVEGSDGKLYLVPSETTGWSRRSMYEGPTGGLKSVSPGEARTITLYVCGQLVA